MISKKDAKFLENLVNNFSKKQIEKVNHYPLLEKGFTSEDIIRGIEVLLSRKITMSDITKKFENKFSNYVGSKYALMVNSGSSANLLSAFALVNPKKKKRLKPGDKFIIPAICWSTSLWPLVQCGLKPEFIDVDKKNYCLDVNLLNKSTKAKAIMNIHILGNSTNMDKLNNFIKSKKKLERYIGKVQPAQLKVLSKRLAEVQARPIANQPALLCEVIIEFTYDIIERSRRRMILESVQMARNGTTDAQIRERLLNYLEEGASAARISELVDAPIIKFDEWFALIDEVSNRTEAKELRGDVSRMLESYPDHAGLLLTRSISEVLSGDGAKAVIRDNIKAAITSAINKYALTGEDMSEVFCSLLKRTNGAFSDVTEPLLEVFIEGHEDGSLFLSDRVIIEMLSVSESWGDELRNVALQFTTVLELEKAVPRLKAQADNIKKTIDGVRG